MKTCPLCESSFPRHHTQCPNDGALLIDSPDMEPGTVIRGKYRIVRQLGRGGMGTVYLAEHLLLGRQRALKFISSDLSQDSAFLGRFRREALAAIELRHPNVVEIVDLDQADDGTPYIAMEYVEGPDLKQALKGGAFRVERALAIARGLALGLGAAHAKGIIHRDVKPENILLAGGNGQSETPKLLDFGIAALKESATAASLTRGLMLTPTYAAPEQWQGMSAGEIDGRADLYALGGVLYLMLTGKNCFRAANTEGWMYQHLNVEPQPPRRLSPELANWPDLDALVLRLLAKNREMRTRDAAELVGQIDAVRYLSPKTHQATVVDEAVFSPSQAPAMNSSRPPRRKGVWLGLLAGGLIMVVLAVLFTSLRSNRIASSPVQTPPDVKQIGASQGNIQNEVRIPAGATLVSPAQSSSGSDTPDVEIPKGLPPPVSKGLTPDQTIKVPNGTGLIEPAGSSKSPAQTPNIAEIERKADALCIKKQYSEAIPLFDQACKGGSARGCFQLGYIFENRGGVKKDDFRVAELYLKACDAGFSPGCNNLGAMYDYGVGVAKDETRAVSLYSKACNAGFKVSCTNLGVMYGTGKGVAKDEFQAAALFSKACDAGDSDGCASLGNFYRLGLGVEKDSTKAKQLLDKGCNMGNQWGCDRLKEMQ